MRRYSVDTCSSSLLMMMVDYYVILCHIRKAYYNHFGKGIGNFIWIYMCVYIYIYKYIYAHIYVFLYIYVCVCVCVCVCVLKFVIFVPMRALDLILSLLKIKILRNMTPY